MRESINNLLPVAAVGGDVFGARLLKKRGVSGGVAGASVVVDLLAQTATQAVFTAIGVMLLLHAGVAPDLTGAALFGAAIMIPAVAGFWLAPRVLSMSWIDRLAEKIETQTGWPSVVGLPALRVGLDTRAAQSGGACPRPGRPHEHLVRGRARNLFRSVFPRGFPLVRHGGRHRRASAMR